MNIFYLSKSAKRAARYHCDKHVVKMILETTQILYTVLWVVYGDKKCSKLLKHAPLTKSGKHGYKKTHMNHPSCKWARYSTENYRWLCKFGLYLCQEYTYRYSKVHACEDHLRFLYEIQIPVDNHEFVPPFLAMPEEFKSNDAVASYREYYSAEKKHFAKYAKRDRPYWL